MNINNFPEKNSLNPGSLKRSVTVVTSFALSFKARRLFSMGGWFEILMSKVKSKIVHHLCFYFYKPKKLNKH